MDTPIVPSSTKKQNRTPNTECVICGRPLYRRPFELKKIRYAACQEHREIAKRRFGVTKAQEESLKLGRKKGTNHLTGIPKSKESKRKRSETMKDWVRNNPDKVKARGVKGEDHYNWKGGAPNLNQSIRRMTEYKKWADEVKTRDGECTRCSSVYNLDCHHIKPFAELVKELEIESREDALLHSEIIFDIDNGITLCKECHCMEHGLVYVPPKKGRRYRPKNKSGPLKGKDSPAWRGGPVSIVCQYCKVEFLTLRCWAETRKFCSKRCDNASRKRTVQ
jgi:hypothetical protein